MRGQDELISRFPAGDSNWPVWTRLKLGYLVLVAFELLVGFFVLQRSELGIDHLTSEPALANQHTATILFMMIVLGTIVAGLLFHSLGRFVIRSRALLDQMSDGVCILDGNWQVYSFNRSFAKIIGVLPEEINNQSIFSLMPGCKERAVPAGDQSMECEFEGVRSNGEKYCAHLSLFMLAEEKGEPVSRMITLRDTTELKKSQRDIQRLAFVDELTGLANRAQLQRHLEDAIFRAERNRRPFAVLFLDLDGFKDINDSLGHEAGDSVLKEMGIRLARVVRGGDIVARLGGDEFCVVLETLTDEESAAGVATRCLKEISLPFEMGERILRIRSSIGIALFPRDGDSRETILQAADTAMYAAKHGGKHRYALYTPELTAAAECRLSLEHDLRDAIEKHQFELYYQPQVSLHSGRMTGAEALIRWHHPKRGMVSPLEFIEVAERIGMMRELGTWVIDTACQQAAEWMAAGLPDFTVAVNISGSHFRMPSLVDSVREALKRNGLPASRLELEVTEGVMQTSDESIEVFRRIKALGVKIAIDDFGTGYSSLSSLKDLPLDCLKVDKAFVDGMLEKREHSVIIATIVGMGQALGMEVIVEGVETLEHVLYLQGLNCDTVQGYFFSKPVPAAQIPALVQHNFRNISVEQNNTKQRTTVS